MEITTHFGTTPVTLVTNGFEDRVVWRSRYD